MKNNEGRGEKKRREWETRGETREEEGKRRREITWEDKYGRWRKWKLGDGTRPTVNYLSLSQTESISFSRAKFQSAPGFQNFRDPFPGGYVPFPRAWREFTFQIPAQGFLFLYPFSQESICNEFCPLNLFHSHGASVYVNLISVCVSACVPVCRCIYQDESKGKTIF